MIFNCLVRIAYTPLTLNYFAHNTLDYTKIAPSNSYELKGAALNRMHYNLNRRTVSCKPCAISAKVSEAAAISSIEAVCCSAVAAMFSV